MIINLNFSFTVQAVEQAKRLYRDRSIKIDSTPIVPAKGDYVDLLGSDSFLYVHEVVERRFTFRDGSTDVVILLGVGVKQPE